MAGWLTVLVFHSPRFYLFVSLQVSRWEIGRGWSRGSQQDSTEWWGHALFSLLPLLWIQSTAILKHGLTTVPQRAKWSTRAWVVSWISTEHYYLKRCFHPYYHYCCYYYYCSGMTLRHQGLNIHCFLCHAYWATGGLEAYSLPPFRSLLKMCPPYYQQDKE